jgi:hypothetical protein
MIEYRDIVLDKFYTIVLQVEVKFKITDQESEKIREVINLSKVLLYI